MVTEQVAIKNRMKEAGLPYRAVCNAIEKDYGWLAQRLNGYVQMSEEDKELIYGGIKAAENGSGVGDGGDAGEKTVPNPPLQPSDPAPAPPAGGPAIAPDGIPPRKPDAGPPTPGEVHGAG